MKVPVYEQQQRLQQLPINPLKVQAGPDAFGSSVASGVGTLANAALKIREMQDQNASWEMSNDLAVRKSELDRLRVDLNLQNREGKIDSVQMAQLWDEGSKGILERESTFTSGNHESYAKYQASKNLMGEEYKTSMMPDLYKASVTDRSITFTKALNNFEKQISELPPEQAKLAIDAFFDSEQTREFAYPVYQGNWEKEKINLKNGIAKRNAFHLADKVNDIEQIQRYRGMVENNEGSFGDVTADGKIDLLNFFDRKEAQLLEAERRERERLNKEAENWLKDYEKNIFSSLLISPEYVEQGRALVQGTLHENEFKFLQGLQSASVEFNKLSILDQGQHLSTMNNKMRNTPSGDASGDRRRFEFFERMYEYNKKMYEDSPMEYNAMRANVQLKQIPNMGIFTGDASQFAGTLRDRFTLSNNRQVFTPYEVENFQKIAKNMDDNQLSKVFGNLAATFSNNSEGYAIAMKELSNGDNALLGAGMVYKAKTVVDRDTGATSENVAKQIIEGNRLIKNKQITMPPNNEFETAFNSVHANAYNSPALGTAMQAHFESAKALYASFASSQGKQENIIDGKLFAKAMKYTGGEPVKINGSYLMAPLGMDADDFKNRLIYTVNDYSNRGLIYDKYKDAFDGSNLKAGYSFIQSGEGRYILTVGGSAVPAKNGGFVEVNVFKSSPIPTKKKITDINNAGSKQRNVRFGL